MATIASCELDIAIGTFVKRTGVTIEQLNSNIEEEQLWELAGHLGNYKQYVEVPGFGLNEADKADLKDCARDNGHQHAMKMAFKKWFDVPRGSTITYRSLVDILIRLRKRTVAEKVCEIVSRTRPSVELGERTSGKELLPKLVRENTAATGTVTHFQDTEPAPHGPPDFSAPMTCEPTSDIDYSTCDSSKAYNTMVQCSVKLSDAMSQDPLALATALYGEGFISKSTLDETVELNETKSLKGARLYGAVLGKVKNFPKFGNFVQILRSDKVLYGDVLKALDEMFSTV